MTTFASFVFSFGIICAFGIATHALPLVLRNFRGTRTQAALEWAANLALMAWGVLLLLNIPNL